MWPELRAALLAECDPETWLEAVVRELDLHSDAEQAARAISRGVVATGPELLQRCHDSSRIAATLRAAEDYLADPSEEASAAYFHAATRSYPFGAGEGCYSVGAAGHTGKRGDGCASGAGTLVSIAAAIGAELARGQIKAALLAAEG